MANSISGMNISILNNIGNVAYQMSIQITRVLTEIDINDDIRASQNTINMNRSLIHSISNRTNFCMNSNSSHMKF